MLYLDWYIHWNLIITLVLMPIQLQMNELKSQEFCIQTLSEQIDRIPPNSLERLTLERELAELKSRWMEALKSFGKNFVQIQPINFNLLNWKGFSIFQHRNIELRSDFCLFWLLLGINEYFLF